MKITFYGTRGSVPISRRDSTRYGGNSTCLRVDSDCLAQGEWLAIDAGSGIVPMSKDFLSNKGKSLTILQTHYHHDHTLGFALSAFPYLKHIPVQMYGPYEHGIGPREIYSVLMRPPFFPVDFREIASHIDFQNIRHPNSTVLVFHPKGGQRIFTIEAFENHAKRGRQLPLADGRFDVNECLVVKMHRSNHPEQTISYRFEERPTGKVFVFVTDHENQDGVPGSFKAHLANADLLVMDCQYSDKKYQEFTAGFGHATPSYVTRVAKEVGAKVLGLTHHDPASTDDDIEEISKTAQQLLGNMDIDLVVCRDYLTWTVQ